MIGEPTIGYLDAGCPHDLPTNLYSLARVPRE